MAYYLSSATTVAYIDTGPASKTIFLPSTFNIQGKQIYFKDIASNAQNNNITLATLGGDRFENNLSNYVINQNLASVSFVARNGKWYSLTGGVGGGGGGGSGGTDSSLGLSSLSSIVSYGLSSLIVDPGISSLSSIVSYGLSSLGGQTAPGISSLSSIVSYGLSSLIVDPGISSLSSIVSYGLSTIYNFANSLSNANVYATLSSFSSVLSYGLSSINDSTGTALVPGLSSLSSVVSYGLSSIYNFANSLSNANVYATISSFSSVLSYGLSSLRVDPGISSLSSLVSYGLSSLGGQTAPGISSLSSIVSYGLSSLRADPGISSLSSIISYGLSSLGGQTAPGISSLSSIVSYGLSSLRADPGISSLSSIISYGLSSLGGQTAPGISSLSSLISFGLSSIYDFANVGDGISSLSSIVSYGLSSLGGQTSPGISSLSSVVSYGLSSLITASGISSLSSVVSYGLSSLRTASGISSLSSVVSYGLSSLRTASGISSLSSVVSYGLSSLRTASGISSLSSIVSYGLSTFIIPLSTFSTAISTRFTTSSFQANVISSSYGAFSTLSTGNILVGYVTSPLQVDVGVTTGDLVASTVTMKYGYVTENLGIGKEAPYWYALDVSGASRLPVISSVFITASSFVGDGSQVINAPNPGVSSLSSIVSYGLSSLGGQTAPGISSLSTIVSYGLSSIIEYVDSLEGKNVVGGISSLSSVVSYGLSSIYEFANSFNNQNLAEGLSSLSSVVSYGLSSLGGEVGPGVSSLSSIVSYGLSSLGGLVAPGLSTLSSIVSYGLSSLITDPGVSSLSSIVSYGLSSLISAPGLSSLSSIVGYGISSAVISSLTVSENWPIKEYSIGAPGFSTIDVSPSNNPDTVTNAIGKIDKWIYTTLLDQPDTPIVTNCNFGVESSNTYLLLFTPPFQFKVNFMDIWMPFISSLNVSVYNRSTGSNVYFYALSDKNYLPNSPVGSNTQGIFFDCLLTFNTEKVGYTYTSGGTTYSNLLYCPISNVSGTATYDIFLYYANYSALTIHNTSNPWIISLDAFPPSSPNGLGITVNNRNTLAFSFTLSNVNCNDPNITTGVGATYQFANNQITFSNLNNSVNPRRYNYTYSPVTTTITCNAAPLVDKGSNVSIVQGGLAYDTFYSFRARVQNTVSGNYSLDSSNSGSNKTDLPEQPSRITSINSNVQSTWFFPTEGILASDNFTTTYSVLQYSNISNAGGIVHNINLNNSIAIHTASNPGSTNQRIAFLQVVTSNSSRLSNTLQLDGWGAQPLPYTSNRTGTHTFITTTVGDYYAGDVLRSNFYLVGSNTRVTINCNFLIADDRAYSYIINYSNVSNVTMSCNFGPYYVDDVRSAPVLLSFSNYRELPVDFYDDYVSGILSLKTSTQFAFNIDLSNYARYFLPNVTNFLTVSIGCNGNLPVFKTTNSGQTSNFYTLTDTEILAPPYPTNGLRFKMSNYFVVVASNYWTSNSDTVLYTQVTARSLVGTMTTTQDLPFYYDIPSMCNLAVAAPRFEANSNQNSCNFKTYNNTSLIYGNTTSNMYNYELPLVGGYYRAGSNASQYYRHLGLFYNYVTGSEYPISYSNIGRTVDVSTRYAMFKYSFSNSSRGTSNIKLLRFSFCNDFNVNYSNIPNCNFGNTIPFLKYKIHNAGIFNTEWLDGNSTKRSYLGFDSDTAINNAPGLRSNNCNTRITSDVRFFSMIPVTPGNDFDVYVKIGLNRLCNARFDFINMSSIVGITPPAPSNLLLDFFGNGEVPINYTLEWDNFRFSDGTPMISNIVTVSNIYNNSSRRYPGKFRTVLDFESNTYIAKPFFNSLRRFESNAFGGEPNSYIFHGMIFNPSEIVNWEITGNYAELAKMNRVSPRLRFFGLGDTSNFLEFITNNDDTGCNFKSKLKAFAGIFTEWDYTPEQLDSNVDQLSNILVRYGTSNIECISIGNETFLGLSREYPNPSAIVVIASFCNFSNYVVNIKSVLTTLNDQNPNRYKIIPIGINDTTSLYKDYVGNYSNQTLCNYYNSFLATLDFAGVNLHPMYGYLTFGDNNSSYEDAGLKGFNMVYNSYNNLSNYLMTNTPSFPTLARNIIIGETTLPTESYNKDGYFFTDEVQYFFNSNLIRWQEQSNIKIYYFSATDAPYKATEYERNTGLYIVSNATYINDIFDSNIRGDASSFGGVVQNCDTWYNCKIQGLNDAGFGSCNTPYSNISLLPNPKYPPFYDSTKNLILNSRFRTGYPYSTAYSINSVGNRVPATNIINISNSFNVATATLYNSPDSLTSGNYIDFYITSNSVEDPITVNFSNSGTGKNYPGRFLSNFTFFASLSNNNRILYNTRYRFNNELFNYSPADTLITTFSNTRNFYMYLDNLGEMYTVNSYYGDYSFSGFFLQATPRIRVFDCNIIVACNTPYTFIMSNNYGCNISTDSYWFDDLDRNAGPPSVLRVFGDIPSMTNRAYYDYVTGVLSYKTNNCNFNFWIQASNLGNNFFRNKPVNVTLYDNVRNSNISNYTFNYATTRFYSDCNLSREMTTNVSQNNVTYFYWQNVDTNAIVDHYSLDAAQRMYCATTACNLNSNNLVNLDCRISNMYIDTLSLNTILYSRSSSFNSNDKGTYCNWGERVTSGFGSYPLSNTALPNNDFFFGSVFNQCNSLLSTYSNELQLVAGKYTGYNATVFAYANYGITFEDVPGAGAIAYPDYTSIRPSTRQRYVTFRWSIASNDVTSTKALLGVVHFRGHNIPSSNNGTGFWSFRSPVTFQYKLVGTGTPSSGWFNGNAINTDSAGGRNSNWFVGNGCNGGANPTTTIFRNSSNTRNIWLYSTSGDQGKPPFTLYVRLGFPPSCNYSLNNIVLCNVNNS